MTLNGVEVAAKITGTGAKELAVLLYAVLKDQKKTKGKTRLSSMLRSGKELKVFAVKESDLEKFCKEAKKYGVLYCVLRDKSSKDGLADVMVRAEDASKVNRIFERFQLTTVDIGQIQQELDRVRAQQEAASQRADPRSPEGAAHLVEELLQSPPDPVEELHEENPTMGPAVPGPPSEPSLETKNKPTAELRDGTDPFPRTSIRQELKSIKADRKSKRERQHEPRKRNVHRDRLPLSKARKER